MRRSVIVSLALIVSIIFLSGLLFAQALTLGSVTIQGQVKVTGPGGMVYTGAEESAPLFPGSAVEVGKGQATVNLAGQGTIKGMENSRLVFHGDNPYLERGTFQVKALPGRTMTINTPQGMIVARSQGNAAVFSVVVKGGKTRASLVRGHLALEGSGGAVVYKLEGEKYLLQGEKYAFAGRGEALMASKGAMAGAGAAPGTAGGASLAEVGSNLGMLPIALGVSGVAASAILIGAEGSTSNHHHHRRPASPSSP